MSAAHRKRHKPTTMDNLARAWNSTTTTINNDVLKPVGSIITAPVKAVEGAISDIGNAASSAATGFEHIVLAVVVVGGVILYANRNNISSGVTRVYNDGTSFAKEALPYAAGAAVLL